MLKRKLIRRNLDDTIQETRTKEKVLAKVSTFFDIRKWLVVSGTEGSMHSVINAVVCFKTVACFKMKTVHENLHRNKAKNVVLNPATNQ